MEEQTEHAGCARTGTPFLRALALLPLLLLLVVALLVAVVAAAFPALLLLPPPLPPLLKLAMPSQLPVPMLIIPAALVAATAGAAVAAPSPPASSVCSSIGLASTFTVARSQHCPRPALPQHPNLPPLFLAKGSA